MRKLRLQLITILVLTALLPALPAALTVRELFRLSLDPLLEESILEGAQAGLAATREMLAETGTHPEDVDGLINYARRIEDVKMAVLLQELENGSRAANGKPPLHVSLRSDGSIDVAEIAANFGGGGHKVAAGFNTDAPLEETRAQIVRLAEKL